MIEKYELYLALRKDFEKIYRYRWHTARWHGPQEWHEAADTLSDIIYKSRECWIEHPEIIEAVS